VLEEVDEELAALGHGGSGATHAVATQQQALRGRKMRDSL
jgi:hypothetical protein